MASKMKGQRVKGGWVDEANLLDLLDEIEHGPPPCPHSVTMNNGGWTHERDPNSAYYLEWVHGDPNCRRSKFPGKNRTQLPKVGWSKKKQKDVPL